MMVCLPDWLFLLLILSILVQAAVGFYGSFQGERFSSKLSGISSRCDELFVALQQVVYSRNASRGNRNPYCRRAGELYTVPEAGEENPQV
ncbi:v3 [Exomis microphylla associated virus]|uniref:V3 n=1 Tax=Exomis microphylla associated virus TaxID=2093275 RepID=A0A2I8B2K8_9GEMI|nr:v3 [Exomis microphylla associated virus]AUT11874.1 v3 [Exomis microphylla associated virus]